MQVSYYQQLPEGGPLFNPTNPRSKLMMCQGFIFFFSCEATNEFCQDVPLAPYVNMTRVEK